MRSSRFASVASVIASFAVLVAGSRDADAQEPGTPSDPPTTIVPSAPPPPATSPTLPALPPPTSAPDLQPGPASTASSSAAADAASVAASRYSRPTPPPVEVWYGWQTLVVDAASLGAGIVLGTGGNTAGGTVFLLGYLIGPPVVHFVHGNIGKGFADLGIRLAAPTVLGLTGALVGLAASHDNIDDAAGGFIVGGAIGTVTGYLVAVVVDAAALAYDKVPVDSDGPKNAFTWSPAVTPLRSREALGGNGSAGGPISGATIGIRGTF